MIRVERKLREDFLLSLSSSRGFHCKTFVLRRELSFNATSVRSSSSFKFIILRSPRRKLIRFITRSTEPRLA